jgi:hypothetical protein
MLRTERSAFPQFPIKRPGASTVATGSEDDDSDADGSALGDSDSVADIVGAGAAESSLSFPPERTRAARSTIATSTANTTFGEVPCFGLADGFSAERAAAAVVRLAAGVVDTFTRSREPDVGTGGTTNFDEEDERLADFLTARFAVFLAALFLTVRLAVDFLAVDFFVTFLAALFLTVRLAVDFLAALFLTVRFAVDFLATFLAADFFLTATLTPWIALCVNRRTRTGISLA